MISHKHKFIFIHISSTGGTSIKKALATFARPLKHVKYNDDEVKDYFKFTFVRNPWDRLVSRYYFLMRKFPKNDFTFEEWLRGADFNRDRQRLDYSIKAKSVQQLDYLTIDGEIAVDYIGKFENIQEDFNNITDKIGINRIELLKLNSTEHRHYREYYTDELVELVTKWFKADITYFNYFWKEKE